MTDYGRKHVFERGQCIRCAMRTTWPGATGSCTGDSAFLPTTRAGRAKAAAERRARDRASAAVRDVREGAVLREGESG